MFVSHVDSINIDIFIHSFGHCESIKILISMLIFLLDLQRCRQDRSPGTRRGAATTCPQGSPSLQGQGHRGDTQKVVLF